MISEPSTGPRTGPHTPQPPNHHAHYPKFHGVSGVLAALSMAFARGASTSVAIELSDLQSSDRLIDIGCGPGAPARVAAKQVRSVVAIDPAPIMLRVARLIPSKSNIEWSLGRAEATGVADESATAVWALATVHHWSDLERSVQEVLRVLRPNGRMIAIERRVRADARGHASHGWTVEQGRAYAKQCLAVGFSSAEMLERSVGDESFVAVRAVR